MCTLIHMKGKRNKNQNFQNYFILRDAADAFEHGGVKSDRRVQVKLPSFIVDELDNEFPDQDRSTVIAQAAIEVLLRKKRISDPELEGWQAQEQYDLDRMWDFLDELEEDDV